MNSLERFEERELPNKECFFSSTKKGKGKIGDNGNYFSSPGLSWDAMLKMTGVKLEKTSDIDKYLFIEKGLRGGFSYISKRYAKANNKWMKNYDPKKQPKFITYLDMNNLYGCGLSDYLSYGEFKWLKNVDCV